MIDGKRFSQKDESKNDTEHRHKVQEDTGLVRADYCHGIVPENIGNHRWKKGHITDAGNNRR